MGVWVAGLGVWVAGLGVWVAAMGLRTPPSLFDLTGQLGQHCPPWAVHWLAGGQPAEFGHRNGDLDDAATMDVSSRPFRAVRLQSGAQQPTRDGAPVVTAQHVSPFSGAHPGDQFAGLRGGYRAPWRDLARVIVLAKERR